MPDFDFEFAELTALLDGSKGTLVRFGSNFFNDYSQTLDRFGNLVSQELDGNFNQFITGDVFYPDGSEFHFLRTEASFDTERRIEADGTIIDSITSFEDTSVTTTEPNPVVRTKIVNEFGLTSSRIDYIDGQKDVALIDASGARRILQYDAAGHVDLEQRFDPAGQLTYEVRGRGDGVHTSTLIKSGVETITTFTVDGKAVASVEVIRADGTHDTTAKAAGVVFGGENGNDHYTGFTGGSDTFVFGADFGNDAIRNFEAGKDVLKFLDPTIDASDVSITYSGYGNNTVLHVGDEGTITLQGLHLHSVDELHIITRPAEPYVYGGVLIA